MVAVNSDLVASVCQGVVVWLALLALIGGGFSMADIEGVVVDDEHPPPEDSLGEGGS